MRISTATEIARNFSQILDDVGKTGDEVAITRHGRVVARLVPERPSMRVDLSHERRFPLIEELLRPTPDKARLLRELLTELEDLGCSLLGPRGSQRRDYVNVSSPGARSRILSVHTVTGRAEFQTDSWDSVHSLGPRFKRLAAGNKAAHPLDTFSDVEIILAATKMEIDRKS